jgi:N-acetylglutamate synthase-like GNAT family acetyltransferase
MLDLHYLSPEAGLYPAPPLPETELCVRMARAEDWPPLRALLREAGLRLAGIAGPRCNMLVLEREGVGPAAGGIRGCLAVEHGPTALLRSLVVSPDDTIRGYDGLLIQAALRMAQQRGARDAVLIVETASQLPLPARRLETVAWHDLRRACPECALVRELSSLPSSDALALRLALPHSVVFLT